APASTKAGTYRSGFSIIRCTSSGRSVALRNDATTGGPMVILGTKCPSITSTCSSEAPPSAAACTCSASRAKSAERMDGASSIMRFSKCQPILPAAAAVDATSVKTEVASFRVTFAEAKRRASAKPKGDLLFPAGRTLRSACSPGARLCLMRHPETQRSAQAKLRTAGRPESRQRRQFIALRVSAGNKAHCRPSPVRDRTLRRAASLRWRKPQGLPVPNTSKQCHPLSRGKITRFLVSCCCSSKYSSLKLALLPSAVCHTESIESKKAKPSLREGLVFCGTIRARYQHLVSAVHPCCSRRLKHSTNFQSVTKEKGACCLPLPTAARAARQPNSASSLAPPNSASTFPSRSAAACPMTSLTAMPAISTASRPNPPCSTIPAAAVIAVRLCELTARSPTRPTTWSSSPFM